MRVRHNILVSIGLQNQLVTAVFVILLSAVLSATKPVQPKQDQPEITETGKPSLVQGINQFGHSLAQHLIPRTPSLINCHNEPCIALTFDDGPDPNTTPIVLDVLKAQAAPATFFVVGSKMREHPELARRAAREGHEMGNHSYGHPYFTKILPDKMRAEIDETSNTFLQLGMVPPRIVRPPYGSINKKVVETIKEPIILWNTDPHDWSSQRNLLKETDIVVSTVRPGAIIVLHDIKRGTAAALPELIAKLRKAGFKLVTISQLLDLNESSTGVYYGR